MTQTLISEKERLIRAIRWISDNNQHNPNGIQEAALRYDLSPTDEEFLLDHFIVREKPKFKPLKLLGLIKIPTDNNTRTNSFQHFFYMKWWLALPIIIGLFLLWYYISQQATQCG
jgi:hypothetical protein